MAKVIDVKIKSTDQTKKYNKSTVFEIYLRHTRIDRKLRSTIEKVLKSNHISLTEWLLLDIINQQKGNLSMKQAAKILGVNLPQITSLTSRLVSQQLIVQKTNRHDRRQHLLQTTVKGRALLRLVKPKLNTAVSHLMKPIPDNYLSFYNRVADKLSESSQV
ncbi:MAG TPA: MarR family transcriptional regulator [Candidatus Saccharimonadales bacterium]|nr:MarR family transcriptional regulator [Candidatus Saccharimonadales bacterium]